MRRAVGSDLCTLRSQSLRISIAPKRDLEAVSRTDIDLQCLYSRQCLDVREKLSRGEREKVFSRRWIAKQLSSRRDRVADLRDPFAKCEAEHSRDRRAPKMY